jgi:dihydroorotase-like cyclic amidohydrolase
VVEVDMEMKGDQVRLNLTMKDHVNQGIIDQTEIGKVLAKGTSEVLGIPQTYLRITISARNDTTMVYLKKTRDHLDQKIMMSIMNLMSEAQAVDHIENVPEVTIWFKIAVFPDNTGASTISLS